MSTPTPVADLQRLSTIQTVAKRCDVHPRTVRRWIAAGHLEALRLPGGDLRVTPDALAKMLGVDEAA